MLLSTHGTTSLSIGRQFGNLCILCGGSGRHIYLDRLRRKTDKKLASVNCFLQLIPNDASHFLDLVVRPNTNESGKPENFSESFLRILRFFFRFYALLLAGFIPCKPRFNLLDRIGLRHTSQHIKRNRRPWAADFRFRSLLATSA